jgi:uncharacterized RDD family membrane protein YckC
MEKNGFQFKATVQEKRKNKEAGGELDCLLTDDEIILPSDPPLTIPLARISNRQLNVRTESVATATRPTPPKADAGAGSPGELTITYFDDANQKQRVFMEMAVDEAMNLNAALSDAVKKAKAEQWDSLPLEMKYADFSIRLVARLIDGVILGVVNWILRVLLGAKLGADLAYVVLGLIVVYDIGFWTWRAQTPGKMICGLKIIMKDGRPINFFKAVLRYIGYYISGIPLWLGYLWIIWDRKKQGFHDKIAGTYVVQINP